MGNMDKEKFTMNEEWKEIKWLNAEYAVSNLGNVCKYEYARIKMIVPHKDRCGYLRVSIKGKTYAVHRLVAEAFIPNPYNYPIVHHIDERKSNNIASNLIWCTYQQNNIFGVPARSGKNAKKKYVILQMDLNENVIAEWNTFEEAKQFLEVKDASLISKCAHHSENRRTAYGYMWDLRQAEEHMVNTKKNSVPINLLNTAYALAPAETLRCLEEIIDKYS